MAESSVSEEELGKEQGDAQSGAGSWKTHSRLTFTRPPEGLRGGMAQEETQMASSRCMAPLTGWCEPRSSWPLTGEALVAGHRRMVSMCRWGDSQSWGAGKSLLVGAEMR